MDSAAVAEELLLPICQTCGQQTSERRASECLICADDRQYIPEDIGQVWTSMSEMEARGFKNVMKEREQGLWGLGIEPRFGIGQVAILIQTDEGNILWDCVPLLDDDARAHIKELGGLAHIVVSHPHFVAAAGTWAEVFKAKVHLHEADRSFIVREHPRFSFWSGDELQLGSVRVVRLGGHFSGSSVVHITARSDGKGVLLSSDTIHCVPHRRWMSFMYSFPNLLPLPAAEVKRIRQRLEDLPDFDRLYGAFWQTKVDGQAKACALQSADRYLGALAGVYHA